MSVVRRDARGDLAGTLDRVATGCGRAEADSHAQRSEASHLNGAGPLSATGRVILGEKQRRRSSASALRTLGRVNGMQPDPAALAQELLAMVLPDRYEHVAGVASRARMLAQSLATRSSGTLVAAAWLHDVGYSPALQSTGFHPLDGARYLARRGFDADVVALVAFHSGARIEAELRGLSGTLDDEFGWPDPDLLDLLTFCDMTTGPRGQRMTVDERLEEILGRYVPTDVVHRSVASSADQLRATVRNVEARLMAQSQ